MAETGAQTDDFSKIDAEFPDNDPDEVDKLMEMYVEEESVFAPASAGATTRSKSDLSTVSVTLRQETVLKAPVMEGINYEDPGCVDDTEAIEKYAKEHKEFFALYFPESSQSGQMKEYVLAAFYDQIEEIKERGEVDYRKLFESLDLRNEKMKNHNNRTKKLEEIGPVASYDRYFESKFNYVIFSLGKNYKMMMAPTDLMLELDSKTNHLYCRTENQTAYEVFRDHNYKILGKVIHEENIKTCGLVTFKGPQSGEEFVFEVNDNPRG